MFILVFLKHSIILKLIFHCVDKSLEAGWCSQAEGFIVLFQTYSVSLLKLSSQKV